MLPQHIYVQNTTITCTDNGTQNAIETSQQLEKKLL